MTARWALLAGSFAQGTTLSAALQSPSPSPDETAATDYDLVFPWILGASIVAIIVIGIVLLITRRRDS